MKKKAYITPQVEPLICDLHPLMEHSKTSIDGENKENVEEGDPDIIYSKGNGNWKDDDWDMWD